MKRPAKGKIAGKANPEPVGDNLFHSDDMALARLDNYLLMINSLQKKFLSISELADLLNNITPPPKEKLKIKNIFSPLSVDRRHGQLHAEFD